MPSKGFRRTSLSTDTKANAGQLLHITTKTPMFYTRFYLLLFLFQSIDNRRFSQY